MKKICWGVIILLLIAAGARADHYSGKAGCVISSQGYTPVGTVYGANGSTPLPSTGGSNMTLIEYISLGNDSVINGPSLGGQTGDDIVVSTGNVGYSDLVPFSNQDGKFYYGISGSLSGGVTNGFIVRAWDKDKSDPSARFGESIYFTASTASIGYPPPNAVPLPDFSTIFQQTRPAAPSSPSASGISATPPRATLNWHSSQGARYYVYQVTTSDDTGYNSIKSSGTYWPDGRHFASANSTTPMSASFSAGTSGDNKNYIFRVKAGNSYGESDWSADTPFYIPATPNNNRPTVVSDLQASGAGNSITLTWTAPYLLDAHGTLMAASNYDIRIASSPIVDTWESSNTNPTHVTNWASATPVTGSPYNAILPAPAAYSTGQTLTISVPGTSTYYLALKSYNGTIASYISNVTGAGFGGGGGAQTWTLTIESRASVGGHGINHFSMPFAGPWYAYQQDGTTKISQSPIATAYDLVKAIDSAAGSNIVSTFTQWLGAGSVPSENGVVITGNDPDALGVQSALQAIPLANGPAFELYASQPTKVVIKNF